MICFLALDAHNNDKIMGTEWCLGLKHGVNSSLLPVSVGFRSKLFARCNPNEAIARVHDQR